MRLAEFDYNLPKELIAQRPVEPRDSSRMMVIHRDTGEIEHRTFRDILDYIAPGDLLVANDSRVIPARLFARKEGTGGHVEILLLRRISGRRWEALVKPGRRVQPGARIEFPGHDGVAALATVGDRTPGGSRIIAFDTELDPVLPQLGRIPLPPYIHEEVGDPERYQTVYCREQGSAAAPTAGLHFTPELMQKVRDLGADFAFVTLHIGIDTFRPITVERVEDHEIHSEWYYLPTETIQKIQATKRAGKRVIVVGTTAARVVETMGSQLADAGTDLLSYQPPESGISGWTRIFIYPGYEFKILDALITNFHLPRSSLVLLVSALAGKDLIRRSYEIAVVERYRFFSFGDATLII